MSNSSDKAAVELKKNTHKGDSFDLHLPDNFVWVGSDSRYMHAGIGLRKLKIILEEAPHGDLMLLGAGKSEIDFIAALEAGETDGDTPLVDEKEIMTTAK